MWAFGFHSSTLQDSFKKKNRKVAVMVGNINTAIGRITASSENSKSALSDVRSRLDSLLAIAKNVQAFQALLVAPVQPPEKYIELQGVLKPHFKFGPSYAEHMLMLEGRQAMMRGDVASLCVLCKGTSASMHWPATRSPGNTFVRHFVQTPN